MADPASLFDVMVKRYEYKRQHLNVLHVITLYHRLKRDPAATRRHAPSCSAARPPRRMMAKRIIKLIHSVAEVVNGDRSGRAAARRFFPDYNVKHSARIFSGADVRADLACRQGGVGHRQHEIRDERCAPIGTLDGANIEIREAVGPENFFCSA